MTKRIAAAVLLTIFVSMPVHAGFSEVARAIDSHHGVDRVWIPFLGLARFAVWMVAPKGVHDFQLVTFTGAEKIEARELQQLMRNKIGKGYTPLVQAFSRRSSEWSFVYAKPSANGERIELVVLAHDHKDTVLVRVDVEANVLAREVHFSPRNVVKMARR
ncbi:MAG: hypothetical protein M3Q69_20080 [Acidobacteriota bacterium]|nr:hypothetical protein [Acidobacteriota bacterium]